LQQQANYPLALVNEVLNNQSTFWLSLDIKIDMDLQVSHTIIYNAIQKFYNLNRSKEEQSILKTEILRLVKFWVKQKQQVKNTMIKLEKEVKKFLLN
jgi:hypothetical protein